jgi:putative transcriptional regulator
VKKIVANHITLLRQKAGIKTAKEAAKLLRVSSGMMYQVEEGLKNPGSKLACDMARLFGCSLDAIFMPSNTTGSSNIESNKELSV